jgi:hypothetical protein
MKELKKIINQSLLVYYPIQRVVVNQSVKTTGKPKKSNNIRLLEKEVYQSLPKVYQYQSLPRSLLNLGVLRSGPAGGAVTVGGDRNDKKGELEHRNMETVC